MSFIFDVTKKTNSISYAVFYSMQYTFWQVVVIGGILTDKPLSAKLLSNSLTLFGKEPEDLVIDDEKTIRDIKDKDGVSLRFGGGDLLYALHKATMFVKAIKNEDGTWRLEGEINDTYDFTEFKDLKEYADNKEAILTDIFSTLLNNFGVASSEYGVIKTYEVKIKFNFSNYVIE